MEARPFSLIVALPKGYGNVILALCAMCLSMSHFGSPCFLSLLRTSVFGWPFRPELLFESRILLWNVWFQRYTISGCCGHFKSIIYVQPYVNCKIGNSSSGLANFVQWSLNICLVIKWASKIISCSWWGLFWFWYHSWEETNFIMNIGRVTERI